MNANKMTATRALHNVRSLMGVLDYIGRWLFLPAAATLGIVWALQHNNIAGIKLPELPTKVIQSGDSFYVTPPIQFSKETKQIAYDAWVTDDRGNTVFQYPRMMLDRETGADPNQFSIRFPTMNPGTYFMNARAFYRLNPLQTAEATMELSKVIVIKNEDKQL